MSEQKLPSTELPASSIDLALSASPAVVATATEASNAAAESAVPATVIEAPAAAKLPPNTELKEVATERTETPVEDATDINDFLAAKGAAPLPAEAKKPETKPAEVLKPQVTTKPAAEATAQSAKVERDLTSYTPDEQKVLRGMSNEAWAFVSPKLVEHKNLAKVLGEKDKQIADLKVGKQMMPESYYEHPNAFQLTPEYNNSAQVLNIASAVQAHWKEQFVKIRQGEDWHDIDINPKTGQIVVNGTAKKADATSEAAVMEYMNFAAQQVEKSRSNILEMQAGFKERHNNAVGVLKDAEEKHFSAYKDPNHPYAPVMKSIAASIPAELRGSPLASLLIKSSTAVIQLSNLLKEAQVKLAAGNGAQVIAPKTIADKRNAGPTEADTQVSTSSGQKTAEPEVTIDDFMKAKA